MDTLDGQDATVVSAAGNIIFSMTGPDLPVEVDGGTQEVPVQVSASRCDTHALIEATRKLVGHARSLRCGLTCDQLVTYCVRMDDVFKALADPTRRSLLDDLFVEDGQSLSSLERRYDMTRFGVGKHLRQLEDANLVVTRRRGREKLHFLNAVPIRLVHDRWVSKYAEPWVAGLSDLKQEMEHTMEKVFEIYIRTTPERLWDAITDPDTRARFHFGNRVESDWEPGSSYAITNPHAEGPLADGQNLEVDPPRRLVQSMTAHFDDDVEALGATRVTWEIEAVGDSCRLTVVHDQLPPDAPETLYGGWPMVLSGLKTWLETGEELTTPGSLMYGD